MAPFPLALSELLGHWPSYLVYLAIGFAFGYVLEISGFGKSTKLAAQFYFKEMTVLKVMFTAIIVAMVGVFLATGVGLLDYNLIWVNPTYLWPGIVGGVIMGVGFIIGGFCPGTSLVSAATGKIDGIFFVLGVFFGIFLFGESVSLFEDFWNSSFMGRFTLMDLLNVNAGVIVLGVVIMAIAAFYFAEQSERILGGINPAVFGKWRYGAASAVVIMAAVVLVVGQPTNADKWRAMEDEQQPRLDNRTVYASPAEILHLMEDPKLTVEMVDVRSETDFNLFHILDAQNIPLSDILDHAAEMRSKRANTVFVLMSNDEVAATEAWRLLVAESVPNIYILEGGINNWLTLFSDDEFKATYQLASYEEDSLAYRFPSALGSRYPAADPNPDVFDIEYNPVVELQTKRGPTSGGCG
ncbi:MAG: YeeE/YedE thiosulfate transporter family protein [Chloroflexota bacterium]